jgi:hypothetical protein
MFSFRFLRLHEGSVLLCLFDYTVSITDTRQVEGCSVSNELEGMWKEALTGEFDVLSRHFAYYSVSQPEFR